MRRNAKDVLDKPGPLEGIKVVEYAVFHAGPGAGAILGDLGADVVKIEADYGDPLRHWGRVGKTSYSKDEEKNPMFEFSNRNKKGIYLDIGTEKGRAIFEKLVKEADVFLTNLRKSTKPKLKIDYETISAINPKIIYHSVSGYGKEGPVADIGAFDPLGQARSGMMHLTDSKDPVLLQLAILDQSTAITASHAIMTALFIRERYGIGQEVHNSLYSTALWLMHANLLLSNIGVSVSDLAWVRSRNTPLRNNFQCKDGRWIIGTHHPVERYWPKFCEITGQQALIEDPRYIDEENRQQNCEELVAHFDKVFATKTQAEWIELSTEAGLMFAPVQDIKDVVDDPQAIANNYVVDFDHPSFGKMVVPGYPIDFSTFSAGMRSSAPHIGEHTDKVLGELGFTDQEIGQLKKDRIIR
ncbi:MAG: CoA transferase [Proteobacteria bacterium]|nr:CoA transferase [Pseudomonadota bacterium]